MNPKSRTSLVQTNINLVRRFLTAIDSNDLDAACDMMSPDCRFDVTGAPEPLSRDAWKQYVGSFLAAIPDMVHDVEHYTANGDWVHTRLTINGTHSGDMMGIAATGRRVSINAQQMFKVKDGRIAAAWGRFDLPALLRQVGPESHAIYDRNVKLAHQAVEAYNAKGDLSALDACYAANYVHHDLDLPIGLTTDLEAHKKQVYAFQVAFPDHKLSVDEIICEGNTIASRWTFEGTQTGPLGELKATNRRVKATAVSSYRIDGGKIAEGWVNFDFAGLMRQLGVTK